MLAQGRNTVLDQEHIHGRADALAKLRGIDHVVDASVAGSRLGGRVLFDPFLLKGSSRHARRDAIVPEEGDRGRGMSSFMKREFY